MAVTATTPGGTSLPGVGNPYYTYVPLPVVNTLNPTGGPATGGSAVTVSGSNLGLAKSVQIAGIAAPFVAVSSDELVATSPGGVPGPVIVQVITPGGVSNTATYQLLAVPGL